MKAKKAAKAAKKATSKKSPAKKAKKAVKAAAKKAPAKKKPAAKKAPAKKPAAKSAPKAAKKAKPKKVAAKKAAVKKAPAKKTALKKAPARKAAVKKAPAKKPAAKAAIKPVALKPAPAPQKPAYEGAAAELVNSILAVLDDAKAENTVAINLEGRSTMADAMVVTTGRVNRHVAAIADQLLGKLKDKGIKNLRVEGLEAGDWCLVDTGDVIIHIFRPEVRAFYNLEKLWSLDAPKDHG